MNRVNLNENLQGTVRNVSYSYGELSCLTNETIQLSGSTISSSYQYDNMGNRSRIQSLLGINFQTTNYFYGEADRLYYSNVNSINNILTNYSYDFNGNLTAENHTDYAFSPNNYSATYGYDARNRLSDREWEIYFEARLGVKMVANLYGRRQLLHLWQEQKGSCPVCHQKITKLSGWHSHHIVWRSNGGQDGAENRVLLHPNCHSQVHSQKLKVGKPRS